MLGVINLTAYLQVQIGQAVQQASRLRIIMNMAAAIHHSRRLVLAV